LRHKNFGVASLTSGLRASVVDSQRGFFKVAFKLEPGSLDELLIFGIVRHRRQMMPNVGEAHPAQVEINERIRAGQKPRSFGRRMFAQLDDDGYRGGGDQEPKQYGERALNPHGWMRKMISK